MSRAKKGGMLFELACILLVLALIQGTLMIAYRDEISRFAEDLLAQEIPSESAQAILRDLAGTSFDDTDGLLLDGGIWTVRDSWIRRRPEGDKQFRMTFRGHHPYYGSRIHPLDLRTDGDAADVYERITGTQHPSLSGSLSREYERHLHRYDDTRNPPSRRAQRVIRSLIGEPLQSWDGEDKRDWWLADVKPTVWGSGPGNRTTWRVSATLTFKEGRTTTFMDIPLESDGDVADLYKRIAGAGHPALHGELSESYRQTLPVAVPGTSFPETDLGLPK